MQFFIDAMTLQDKCSEMGTTKLHCSCPICPSSVLNLDPPDRLLPPSLHPSPPLPSVGIDLLPTFLPMGRLLLPSVWCPSVPLSVLEHLKPKYAKHSLSSHVVSGLIHIFWATSLLSLKIREDGLEYKTGLMAEWGCPISLRPGGAKVTYSTSAVAFRLHHSSASPGKLI